MTKRPLQPLENELWRRVVLSVAPRPGRAPPPTPEPLAKPAERAELRAKPHTPAQRLAARRQPAPAGSPNPIEAGPIEAGPIDPDPIGPARIEPGRHRRIARGREPISARIDLHGLDQALARRVLVDFLTAAQARGARAVLVITGKGVGGQGVLRRRAPEWLADPALRSVVAGLAPAEHQHGGEGALYVALKRGAR